MRIIVLYTLNYYEDKYFAHFKHTVQIYDHCAYTQIIVKKLLFIFTVYKNGWKVHKF